MKTVLIFPPTANPAPSYFGPPYGLALLGAILQRARQEVAAYDYDRRGVEAMLDDVPRMLAEDKPDLVGISVLSVNRGPALLLCRRLKELAPELPIVFGGPFPSLEPELMLRQSDADYVCIGDGDETLLELVQALEAGRPVGEVAGLALRVDGAIGRTATRPRFEDIDSLPFPDFELFPMREMLASHRLDDQRSQLGRLAVDGRAPFVTDALLMVMNSRGCPWQCSFCPLSKWEGRTLFHSAEYVVSMIEHYRDLYDYRTFVFGDNTLTFPKKHARRLFELMIERDVGVEWICMTRSDMVDQDILDLMAASGCKEISYGIESLSQTVQRAMKKKLAVRLVPQAFERTHKAGISTCLMMMVGNEGESRDTMRETTGMSRRLQPDRILINTTKIYPGTDLFDIAMSKGIVPKDYYERTKDDVFSDAPDYTGDNSADELRRLETMLRHRTTYVAVESDAFDRERVERALLMAAWRSDHAVIGGQPGRDGGLLRSPQVAEVLSFAKAREALKLRLHTDARLLRHHAVRRGLQSSGAVDGVIVPLWSMSASHHDVRIGAPGALRQTRKGMLGWTRERGKLAVWAFLDRYNVSSADRWLSWIAQHGASEVLFVYGEGPAGWGCVAVDELPTLTEAGRAMRSAHEVARELGIAMSVTGLPECMLSGGDDDIEIHELGRPFDEIVDETGRPMALARRRQAQKSYVNACDDCDVRVGCEGIYRSYLERNGGAEVRPCGYEERHFAGPGGRQVRRLPLVSSG